MQLIITQNNCNDKDYNNYYCWNGPDGTTEGPGGGCMDWTEGPVLISISI